MAPTPKNELDQAPILEPVVKDSVTSKEEKPEEAKKVSIVNNNFSKIHLVKIKFNCSVKNMRERAAEYRFLKIYSYVYFRLEE